MKNLPHIILIIVLFSSCILTNNLLTDKRIHKKTITESEDVLITTTVNKYSRSKKWFHGTIEIYNKSNEKFWFNFKQGMFIGREIIYPDWNILPVSWAREAFELQPLEKRIWTVAWRTDISNIDFKNIYIVPDTFMIKIKKDNLNYPLFMKTPLYGIDTTIRFERPNLLKEK